MSGHEGGTFYPSIEAAARAMWTHDGGHDMTTVDDAVICAEWLGPESIEELDVHELQRLLMFGSIVAMREAVKLDLDLYHLFVRARLHDDKRLYVLTAEYGPVAT